MLPEMAFCRHVLHYIAIIACSVSGRWRNLQVRKKADGAKLPVREFIDKWKEDARIQKSPALTETAMALEELGQYYMRRGQRAALDNDTASTVLAHLDAAEQALPVKEPSTGLLGGFFGR
jgi:hypothetical protein